MTLSLTPDLLAAAYDFLRATPPFKAWRLPESDDIAHTVEFLISERAKNITGTVITVDGGNTV